MGSIVGGIVGVAGSLLGANKQANAAKDAATLQANSANQDRELQRYIYDQNREDSMPWLEQGKAGLLKLSDLLGTSGNTSALGYGSLLKPFGMSDFQADPGYQFNLAEGQKALDRTASAKGNYFSGAAAKGLQRFSQDYASNEFGKAYDRYNTNNSNIYNRLAGLSGTGQTASNQLTSAGQNYANASGQAGMNAATAQGNGLIGAANAWNSGLSNVTQGLGSLSTSLGDLFKNRGIIYG